MAKLPNTNHEEAEFDERLKDDEPQPPKAQSEQLPTAKPGRMWQNAAARRGQEDEYDNMMANKYGEGW